ncbi:MAG TPA: hypothetical protein VHV47_00775 [Opitutaceae bacterium]|nr:hypothetical protein [Opitutaceae bacterium]
MRSACLALLVSAVLALLLLLAGDLRRGFAPTLFHARAGAAALMLIGSAYIALQALGAARRDAAKGMLLGLAFVLWGAEQFLPAGPRTTAMDTAVIGIFVADLGLVIAGRIRGAGKSS